MLKNQRKRGKMIVDRKKLICAMIDNGMNNKELSEKSGVSITRVSHVRNGNNTTYETAVRIARALNVPVRELIDFEASEHIPEKKDGGKK